MCCFSRPVDSVTATRIFARFMNPEQQAVVYSMSLRAKEDLAMILPIPVAAGAGDDAMKFVDLSGYPRFFDDMQNGFPVPVTRGGRSFGLAPAAAGFEPLKVHDVGGFEASYVPSPKDFARLDERFRLPNGVWEKLGPYANYGFAVFKLKPGERRIHPMAFKFPTAMPGRVFFPTVHIHDGRVHETAEFDHVLYTQTGKPGQRTMLTWTESGREAAAFMDAIKARGLVLPRSHVYRLPMAGELPNRDTFIQAA